MLSLLCSKTRRAMYRRRSKASPFSTPSGFFTKPWQITGIQARARLPSTSGQVGTSRQPRNSSPSFSRMISNIFLAWLRRSSSCGKKNMPTPYSRSSPISIPHSAHTREKKRCEICVRMPTPSPVSPLASFPARCSRCSTIFSASRHHLMAFDAFDIHNGSDAAVVVLQLGAVKGLRVIRAHRSILLLCVQMKKGVKATPRRENGRNALTPLSNPCSVLISSLLYAI